LCLNLGETLTWLLRMVGMIQDRFSLKKINLDGLWRIEDPRAHRKRIAEQQEPVPVKRRGELRRIFLDRNGDWNAGAEYPYQQ
jgi:hypothetical protein